MVQLKRATIRKMATNDTVYTRGLQYYNNKAIINLTWSNATKQYRAVVRGGSNYVVIIETLDGELKYHCNCPASVKYDGACKHVIAALLGIAEYTNYQESDIPEEPLEKKIYQILEYFSRQEQSMAMGETFRLELTITIPTLIKQQGGKAMVQVHAGSNRLYKVVNIKKFLSDYVTGNNIIIGKEFQFIANESRFDDASFRLLEYMLEIFEIQEALGRVYYSNLFSKGQIILTRNMLMKILHLLGEKRFTLEIGQKQIDGVKFLQDRPPLKYDLDIKQDFISIDYNGNEHIMPLTEDGKLLYSNHVIYEPDPLFIKNYVPFYKLLDREKEALRFEGENKHKFLQYVLPSLVNTMEFEISDDIKSKYVVEDMRTKVYLDRVKSGIVAKPVFIYGESEFCAYEQYSDDERVVLRQSDKEYDFLIYLESFHFQPNKLGYLMSEEEDIYQFITSDVNELAKGTDLYYSDEFRKLNIYSPAKLHSSIRLQTGSSLLELSFEMEHVPKEELGQVLQSFILRKKYHRLKGGSFIKLEAEDLENTVNFMEQLGMNGRAMKDSIFYIPKSHAAYIHSIAGEQKFIDFHEEAEFLNFVQRIKSPENAEYELPSAVTAQLRPYQKTGFRWLLSLKDLGLGGILADDMGLGKTLQTIVYITYCKEQIMGVHKEKDAQEEKRPVFLIVCPSSLVYNWQDEIENFSPTLTLKIVAGNKREREEIIEGSDQADILITSYPLLRRDTECYADRVFHTMFIDEAQYIKNPSSQNAKSVKQLKAMHRFALTGTPIENSLSELWSIFDFIMPGYLFTHTKFMDRFEKRIIKNEDTGALEDLGIRIRPFILRRMKKEVLTELPDKIEKKMITDMTDEQKLVYTAYLSDIKNEWSTESKAVADNKIRVLAALTRLRQICAHPSTFIMNYKGGSGKFHLLMNILPNAIANEHRILIFSQFTTMLKLIKQELNKRDITSFYLEGSTSMEDRADYVKRFNSGEGDIFLISLKAGGTGLNLTGADTVIHYDPWWNPATEEQATDRAYRIGQKNTVTVIKLITKGTIEEKIYKLQKKKRELSDSIIDSKEVFLNSLSKEELEELFEADFR